MNTRKTAPISVLAILAAASYAIVMATGVLVIGIVVTAAARGYSLGELYTETFPTFRGAPHPSVLPRYAYAVFFAYVVGAAELAILQQRRIVKRWSQW
jgi:hypothetical protein